MTSATRRELPINPKTAELVDSGRADEIDVSAMQKAVDDITAISKFGSEK